MGMWEEFCTVCGGPPYVFFDDLDLLPETPPPVPSDYTWLESFLGISHREELIPLSDYDGYGNFATQPHPIYNSFDIGCRNDEHDAAEAHGYACHVACYTLLQKELQYSLRYQDVRPLLVDAKWCDLNKFAWSDYGGLAEYQDQGFMEWQLVKDGKLWMIEDPSRNGKNAERILGLWRPLVESGFRRPDGAGIRASEVGVGTTSDAQCECAVNAEGNIDDSRA